MWIFLFMVILMIISWFFKVICLGFYKKWFLIERFYVMIMGIWLFVIILFVCIEVGSFIIYGFFLKDLFCFIFFSMEYVIKYIIYVVVILVFYVLLFIVLIILWSVM